MRTGQTAANVKWCQKGGQTHFDAVDGVDVLHAVQYDTPDLLQALVRAHDSYCASLHEHITLCQELDRLRKLSIPSTDAMCATHLQSAAVRTDNSLSPLDKPLVVTNDIANFNDVASRSVVQDFHRLPDRYPTGEQFHHVACLENDVWVVRFSRCADLH